MYECERCQYKTYAKHSLLNHYKRKNQCEPKYSDKPLSELLNEIQATAKTSRCTDCDKTFTTSSNLYRHIRTCSAKKNALTNKIATLEQAINDLKNATTTTTIQNANTIQNIQQNIHINGLGQEDKSYITEHPLFNRFMIRCIRDKMEGLCDYMVRKHFSPDHPENHNIRKLNKKDDFIDCYDGRKWRIKLTQKVLDEIFRNIEKDFTEFVDRAISEEGILKKEWLDSFMREVGIPLDWDFTGEDYDFEEDMPDDEKERLKNRMYGLACEYIYRHSKAPRAEADGSVETI